MRVLQFFFFDMYIVVIFNINNNIHTLCDKKVEPTVFIYFASIDNRFYQYIYL